MGCKDAVRGTALEPGRGSAQPCAITQPGPFRYFKTSPEIIRLAVVPHVRFPFPLRNVEGLLHERGIEVSHETVRCRWRRFGLMSASEIRAKRRQGMRASRWRRHLGEVFVGVDGVQHDLWRAVGHEGEALEAHVTKTRDKGAALKFLRTPMKRQGRAEEVVTDKLRSYGATLKEPGGEDRRVVDRWENNRAENSHQPFRRRERAMLRFRRMHSLRKFASVRSSVRNHLNAERSLTSRDHYKLARAAALAEWRQLGAA